MGLLPKYATIGNRIRQVREMKGLSQTKFGKSIGISQTFVSDLEKGSVKPPEPLLLAIEYVYKCRREWIIHGDGDMWKFELDHPQVIDMEQTSQRQVQYWSEKLRRIFSEGVKDKIDALKAQLRTLDPGEKNRVSVGTSNAENIEILNSKNPDIVDALRANIKAFRDTNKAKKEKRRYYRFSISVPVDARILDEPGSPTGIITDASQMGLCIQSSHKMEIGKKIDLEIASSRGDDGTPCIIRAQIMWREGKLLDDSEAYQYGIKLIGLSDDDHAKLESLLGGGK